MPIFKSFINRGKSSGNTETRKVQGEEWFDREGKGGDGSGTAKMSDTAPTPTSPPQQPGRGETVIWKPTQPDAPVASPVSVGPDPMNDPVAGWLVIIKGPGRGAYRRLGYGMNVIGRLEGRVALDFGDEEISRREHGVVDYDPRSKTWSVQHGKGVQHTYLDGKPVRAPMELQPGQIISMGKTDMMFVPICGPDFDWQET